MERIPKKSKIELTCRLSGEKYNSYSLNKQNSNNVSNNKPIVIHQQTSLKPQIQSKLIKLSQSFRSLVKEQSKKKKRTNHLKIDVEYEEDQLSAIKNNKQRNTPLFVGTVNAQISSEIKQKNYEVTKLEELTPTIQPEVSPNLFMKIDKKKKEVCLTQNVEMAEKIESNSKITYCYSQEDRKSDKQLIPNTTNVTQVIQKLKENVLTLKDALKYNAKIYQIHLLVEQLEKQINDNNSFTKTKVIIKTKPQENEIENSLHFQNLERFNSVNKNNPNAVSNTNHPKNSTGNSNRKSNHKSPFKEIMNYISKRR